jgi:O-antigen/teichoic acid export membrane protein
LLLYGSAMLGLGVGLERVFTFLSITLAARISGPQTFGGYSVTLATAGTIAAYAGAGIGITAVRFSGDYHPGDAGYRQFVRALAVIAASSAVLAALLTLLGAAPIARLILHNEALVVVLRAAALSSGALVLLECCRGLLLGQQKFYGLLLLSLVSGVASLIALPLAARVSATAMVIAQAGVALFAIIVCLSFSRRLGITPAAATTKDEPVEIRRVFMFGLVQFSAFASISVASWCIASFVVRADPSLSQMGFYSVANQWRGLAAIAPGLLAQVVFSSLTNRSSEQYGGPETVLFSTTIISTVLVMLAGGIAILVLPWALPMVYGHKYGTAELAGALLLATAIIHMAGQPGAQRLTIVRLRAIGAINIVWAALLILFGFILIPGRGAAGAAVAFLLAHTVSNLLVTFFLHREATLPNGYVATLTTVTLGSFVLASLAYLRAIESVHAVSLTVWMAVSWLAALLVLLLLGIKYGRLLRVSRSTGAAPHALPQLSET